VGAPPARVERDDDFIPFRDSVLTWILRDSLCGNSKTVIHQMPRAFLEIG